MFITSQGFKKLINEAYKGNGLKICNTGNGYIINGSWWIIWIAEGCIPKKELASIIELTGELPAAGESFSATKGGNQYELMDQRIIDLMERTVNFEEKTEVTPLIIEGGVNERIIQSPNNNMILLVDNRFIDMIDNSVVRYEDDETQVTGPWIGKERGLLWKNNQMALFVMPREAGKNDRLIGYLENFNIIGRNEDEH